MTLMQETSLKAYSDLKKHGKLQPEEIRVLNVLSEHGPMCDFEIKERTGMEINQVTGRRNGLARKGIVVVRGTKRNPHTGKSNIIWGLYNRLF